MTPYKIALIVATAIIFWSSAVMAKRPAPTPEPVADPAPEVFSVKIEYSNNRILVNGANLDLATVTLGGEPFDTDSASSDTTTIIPFTTEMSDVVDGLGNYVLIITTAGGDFPLTAFIPFAITYFPPGDQCPCESEWNYYGGLSSPNGFSGLTPPSCASDSGDYVTVQFYDELSPLATNYWILRTGWDSSSGYCELWIDGPRRVLDSIGQFNACANYLRDTYVWPGVSDVCTF